MSVVYQNPWFKVIKNGSYHHIEEPNTKNGAAVLILTKELNFLLCKIFRKPIDLLTLEIPRGFGEPGENPKECAIREVKEEVNIDLNQSDLISLGTFYPNSGILSSEVHLYFTEIDSKQLQYSKPADNEVSEIKIVELAEFEKLILNNSIKDSFTITAFLKWKLSRLR